MHPFSIPALTGAYPSCHWARGRIHPGTCMFWTGARHRDKQPCTLTLTPRDNLVTNEPDMHAFGRWEKDGENPRIHGETMLTPHRKAIGN